MALLDISNKRKRLGARKMSGSSCRFGPYLSGIALFTLCLALLVLHWFSLSYSSYAWESYLAYIALETTAAAATNTTTTSGGSTSKEWIPKTTGKFCDRGNLKQDLFKSQDREDKKLLEEWKFRHLCEGRYLEMGGFDGISYSNSYAFHHGLDWKGILVEANPKNFARLETNRPNEIATVHAAVCSERQQVHFVMVNRGYATGIWEFADEEFRKLWWRPERVKSNETIDCVPLIDILHEHEDPQDPTATHRYFDFFSLDIEGGEYEVLKTLDFDSVSFGVVFIEQSIVEERNQRMIEFLTSKGYNYKFAFRRSMWFEHPKFDEIYKDILP